MTSLDTLFSHWEVGRFVYADEQGDGTPILSHLKQETSQEINIIIGPEGGFSPKEHHFLQSHPLTQGVTLGPRILKAETAAICILSIWQNMHGDGDKKPNFKGL